jgi:tetratricopeptide (TPR) repeat protein
MATLDATHGAIEAERPLAQRAASAATRGLECLARWQAEEALESLQRAIKLDQNNPDYPLSLAAACARFGEFDKALEALREFLQREPSDSLTGKRIRALVQEQETQGRLRQVRERCLAKLEELDKREQESAKQLNADLAVALGQARQEALHMRRWLQMRVAQPPELDVVFSPSGQMIVRAGEPISERHQRVLDGAVQEYARRLELRLQEESDRQEQMQEKARQHIKSSAERQIAEIQDRSRALADPVEMLFVERMRAVGLTAKVMQAARQLWLEYRICAGRNNIPMRKPESWAAGVDYTVRRVSFLDVTDADIAQLYGVSQISVRARHAEIVERLDIMPCDYRYFVGDENPLDRLVEAATMLEELEERFRKA